LCTGASAEPRTVNDGVYTREQAKVGEQLYAAQCIACHDKKYFRPVFKTWDGRTLGLLFTVMSTSMPESNPGALPRKEYVDILAYILKLNRYKDGESELDYQNGALDEITIAPRQK
jgi:cytochrome c